MEVTGPSANQGDEEIDILPPEAPQAKGKTKNKSTENDKSKFHHTEKNKCLSSLKAQRKMGSKFRKDS